MPYYVVDKVEEVLSKSNIVIRKSKILILGVSYKKNIDDLWESPALKLIEILKEKGADVDYYDPYVPELPKTRKYNFKMKSIPLNQASKHSFMQSYDLVILTTDHDIFNYKLLTANCKLIIDTRNAFEVKGIKSAKIFKA